jgi:N utilization substance protein B
VSGQPTPGFGSNRRQAARMAAVQAIFQWQQGEGGMRRDADRPLFKDVVEGAVAHKEELQQTLTGALAEDWTWERIDRLVRAILLAGAYELIHRKDVPPRVAINEYVEIAHAFYDQGEQNFVNSVLDRVARQSRSAELAR